MLYASVCMHICGYVWCKENKSIEVFAPLRPKTIRSRIYGYLFVDVYMSRYECLRMNPQGMAGILQKGIDTIIDATIGCKS